MSLPNFENHLFISYAHLDNESLSKGQEGCISLLHQRLSLRIGQLLGDKGLKIWRDKKLQMNDDFDQEIGSKLRVFKVLKTPVPLDKHPAKLQGVLGYEFYEVIDPAIGIFFGRTIIRKRILFVATQNESNLSPSRRTGSEWPRLAPTVL